MGRLHFGKYLIVFAVLCAATWVGLGPLASENPLVAKSAAVVMVTLILWGTGSLPPFLTSLIFFGAVMILGLARADLVFSGFGSAAVWLIISGFVIGSAISVSGLGRRLASFLAPMLAGSYLHMIAGLAIAASLLGFVMPSSTGRAVVMVPIGMALADRVGFHPKSNGRIGIAATLALACNMPSFAILPANIPNMILAGASETLHGLSFSYTSYLALHFPLLGIFKLGLLIILVRVLFPDQIHPQAGINSNASLAERDESSDTAAQRRVFLILAVTLVMWMTDSLHGINAAWIGMCAAILLLLPKVGVVPPKNFNASVDFGMVLFVSAALGLGALVNASGLGKLVGQTLEHIFAVAFRKLCDQFFCVVADGNVDWIGDHHPRCSDSSYPHGPRIGLCIGIQFGGRPHDAGYRFFDGHLPVSGRPVDRCDAAFRRKARPFA